MPSRSISQRAAAFAVIIAFGVGLIGSLSLRPAGDTALLSTGRTNESTGASTGPAITGPAITGPAITGPAIAWRMPTAFGTNLPALGDNPLYVRDALAASSGGRIMLDIYEPSEIVPAFEITDAVRQRKVEAGYTWLGYDQGRVPAAPLLGAVPFGMEPWEFTAWWYEGGGRVPAAPLLGAVPFGMEPWEFTAWWYEGGGRAMGEALYREQGLHPLLCGIIGPETAGWFRTQVRGLDDLKGLKIRFAGLGGKVLQRAGASVTMLPGGEIFQALEKGAIDATEYALPVVDEKLGFDRVAPYNYYPGWHQPATAFHLVVNLALWEALRPADQALLEMACTAGVTRNLARSEGLQGAVIADFEARGARMETLQPEVLRRLRDITDEVLAEEAAANPNFARILASQSAFRADYALWKSRAYLPRDF